MNRALVCVWLCPVMAACGPEPAPHGRSPQDDPVPHVPGRTVQGVDTIRGASSNPASRLLGFGRDPTAEEIAALDIDVQPDGTGLPPGSGTVEEGATIYEARCAACHGPDGLGTPAGWPLVGRNPGDAFDFHQSLEQERRRTIGNYWPYATTLFDYTRRSMPYDEPGSLSDDEAYALTAWMLWRNRIIGYDEVMDATTLLEVVMPAHNRFIPDDRTRPPR